MTSARDIDDHGIIGDGRAAALVSRDGSIDWLCWPRFDSPPVFAALLDPGAGAWSITPTERARVTRRYLDHTNVLETRFETGSGVVLLTDAMTVTSETMKHDVLLPDHEIVRRLECTRGEMELEVVVSVRPDFGRARTRVLDLGVLGQRWEVGSQLLTLCGDLPLALDANGDARARIRISAGRVVHFSFSFDAEAPAVLPAAGVHASERITRTAAWWSQWVGRASYAGPHREAVLRSLLVLKLMSYAPSGAIIAAPTTSLPEVEGGPHNWDYRYCWLRDASFTARVFLQLGFIEDAVAFVSWLLHATRLTQPQLRVLYDVFGNRPVTEHQIAVEGYRGSRPVRVGNAADRQIQLDLYGEVMDATSQLVQTTGELDHETCDLLRGFGRYVCDHWRDADLGIWEPRAQPSHHTHSRLLSWVALDRLDGLAANGHLRIDRDLIGAHRSAVRRDIEDRAYDPRLGCYLSGLDGGELDAAVLLMSWYGFHPASSLRMRSTYARLVERLSPRRGLLYRYEQSRDIDEGAFWLCSFWAV
ncbi:MAG TPA: glycoside hydrolase family 15 protein, partial [Kofleriaceae bacterium]|nr:glycoside hydrolase family 15 protein [Kofleriaceae bacterium]